MKTSMHVAAVTLVTALCLSAAAYAASAAETETPADPQDSDPIESVNRGIFWFNDQLDIYVLEPVATGYDKITPQRVQKSIVNFFDNLRFPIIAGNNLLQGKVKSAASDVARFGVNTTVGILGFFDPASNWGLEAHDEDFGQPLGYWGVPPGPYLVLPFLGPSNPRDASGLAADSVVAVYPWFVALQYTAAAYTVRSVNARAQVLKEVAEAKGAAIDYYVFVRNAYLQHRRALVNDRAQMSKQEEEELYQVEPDHTP